jgi:hypothetical protein
LSSRGPLKSCVTASLHSQSSDLPNDWLKSATRFIGT